MPKSDEEVLLRCYIISDGAFVPVTISGVALVELAVSLRENGKETVRFADRNIIAEGIYVPALCSKYQVMLIPNTVLEEK